MWLHELCTNVTGNLSLKRRWIYSTRIGICTRTLIINKCFQSCMINKLRIDCFNVHIWEIMSRVFLATRFITLETCSLENSQLYNFYYTERSCFWCFEISKITTMQKERLIPNLFRLFWICFWLKDLKWNTFAFLRLFGVLLEMRKNFIKVRLLTLFDNFECEKKNARKK